MRKKCCRKYFTSIKFIYFRIRVANFLFGSSLLSMKKRNGANILPLFINTGAHVQALAFIRYASLEFQNNI